MINFSLESTDRLFEEQGSEMDQMSRDVREEAQKEFGSMTELAFDRTTSAMPELTLIPDDAMLGFNVYSGMDSYMDSMNKALDAESRITVE